MTGVIGATDTEAEVIRNEMTGLTDEEVGEIVFSRGMLYGKEIIFVKSGIGKVNAAITATLLIYRYNVSSIIFSGVAGSLDKRISIGDIVISTDVVQHDMDVSDFGVRRGHIPGMAEWAFEADRDMLAAAKKLKSQKYRLFFGRILTGDQFISKKDEKINLGKDFEAFCVDMESGAVAQVCRKFDIPFLIIRSISDTLTDDSGMEYQKFAELAAQNAKEILKGIL